MHKQAPDGATYARPDGSPPSIVKIQRARLLMAAVEACAAVGAANVTVAQIVSRAGVSRRTFYEHFVDCEECLLGSLEEMLIRVSAHVRAVYPHGSSWRERIRSGLSALLEFLDYEPSVAKVLLVESFGAGRRALELRSDVLGRVSEIVDEARLEEGAVGNLPPLTAEGIVGAVASVLHTRLLEAECRPLHELANPLMSIIVLPYFGPVAARQELQAKRKQTISAAGPPDEGDTIGRLEMRMTYRTMMVLHTIAERPRSSNRDIGQAAGAADQGQISKLLARLKRLGLIENESEGRPKGVPNAWALTSKGVVLHRRIAGQTYPSDR